MAEKHYTCPHCGHLINLGAYFGAMGKGVPKVFTAKERERRALRLAKVRKRRWPSKSPALPVSQVDLA
jgi:hypothetical protein